MISNSLAIIEIRANIGNEKSISIQIWGYCTKRSHQRNARNAVRVAFSNVCKFCPSTKILLKCNSTSISCFASVTSFCTMTPLTSDLEKQSLKCFCSSMNRQQHFCITVKVIDQFRKNGEI